MGFDLAFITIGITIGSLIFSAGIAYGRARNEAQNFKKLNDELTKQLAEINKNLSQTTIKLSVLEERTKNTVRR